MKQHTTYALFLLCFNFLFSQGKDSITYEVKPIPFGAKKIDIIFNFFPTITSKVNTKNISGAIDFSLQIIDKDNVEDPSVKGEEIAFFIETLSATKKGTYTSSFSLPKHLSLTKKLPDNKVYRLVSKDDTLVLLDSKNPSYANHLSISCTKLELTLGGNSQESLINMALTNKPNIVERGSNFTINTLLEADLYHVKDQPSKVKFEIHIVNKEDVFKIEDVNSQIFVSDSGTSLTVPNGSSKLNFELTAPEIPNKYLPKGKTYRVRLYNDPCCEARAYPFPFELITVNKKSEKNIFSKKSKISISPNPAKDFLIVNSIKKSASYKIYDMSGTLVKKQETLRRISVADLKPGVYLLATDFGVTRFTKK